MADSRRLPLPRDFTIGAVAEWRTLALAWLDDLAPDDEPIVDASAVSDADGAGVQVLVALANSLARDGRRLRLDAPAPVLANACRLLGSSFLLEAAGEADTDADADAAGAGDTPPEIAA